MTSTFYSRELSNLTLFYLPKPRDKTVFESLYASTKSKKPRKIGVLGVVLSSLRPVTVYLHFSVYRELEMSRAYVVPRFTSNTSLHVDSIDEVIEVNDAKRLREVTGKSTPLPLRILYMLKEREQKVEQLEPKEVARMILNRQPVYALTAWPRMLDILFAKQIPAVELVALMVVWSKVVKIWCVPQKNPIEYLSIDSLRQRLKIPEELVTRIVRYDPLTNVLLIVQPLQSITLDDLRKMVYRRPRLPLTYSEMMDVIASHLKAFPEIEASLSELPNEQ